MKNKKVFEMDSRSKLILTICEKIMINANNDIFLVGIDGLDGSGKSYIGDEISRTLIDKGISVIRSSTDYFHNPRNVRYKLGKGSPKGYFEDSFNYPKLKELLLNTLKKSNSKFCRTKYFNHKTDSVVNENPIEIKNNSILIFDGIFLHRKELKDYWDYSIFLNVSRKESLHRCYLRDSSGSPDIDSPKNTRYVKGQKIYLNKCFPEQIASIVINNENYDLPFIEKIS